MFVAPWDQKIIRCMHGVRTSGFFGKINFGIYKIFVLLVMRDLVACMDFFECGEKNDGINRRFVYEFFIRTNIL